MRILVVEDEKRLADSLSAGLRAEGYAIDVAANGPDGLWLATQQRYAAIVLDIMLPGLNGYRVCQRLRAAGNSTPILEFRPLSRRDLGTVTRCIVCCRVKITSTLAV